MWWVAPPLSIEGRESLKKESVVLGRPATLRHTNAHIILKLLREAGSCSRADLVRSSSLSAPTVTNVVRDLLAKNLVEPLGEGESRGGRPPDMIRFKAERGCILAVEISATHLSCMLTDLNGAELTRHSFSLAQQETTPAAICGFIRDALVLLLRRQKLSRDQLLAMVVGVPAITNVDEGVVLSISTLDSWRSVPLRKMLRKIVPCPVVIENDMNLAAQGERFLGAAQNEANYILISIGNNVGAGIVLHGRIHHGAEWSAGEIGYLRLPNTSRKDPKIHEFGELESVLTDAAFVANWNDGSTRGKREPAARVKVRAAAEVLDLAQAGDVRAGKIVESRAGIVSDIIVNLSLVLNPGLILLSGAIGGHPEMIRSVKLQLRGSEFAVPRVEAGKLGDMAVLWGGVAIALEMIPSLLLPQPAE